MQQQAAEQQAVNQYGIEAESWNFGRFARNMMLKYQDRDMIKKGRPADSLNKLGLVGERSPEELKQLRDALEDFANGPLDEDEKSFIHLLIEAKKKVKNGHLQGISMDFVGGGGLAVDDKGNMRLRGNIQSHTMQAAVHMAVKRIKNLRDQGDRNWETINFQGDDDIGKVLMLEMARVGLFRPVYDQDENGETYLADARFGISGFVADPATRKEAVRLAEQYLKGQKKDQEPQAEPSEVENKAPPPAPPSAGGGGGASGGGVGFDAREAQLAQGMPYSEVLAFGETLAKLKAGKGGAQKAMEHIEYTVAKYAGIVQLGDVAQACAMARIAVPDHVAKGFEKAEQAANDVERVPLVSTALTEEQKTAALPYEDQLELTAETHPEGGARLSEPPADSGQSTPYQPPAGDPSAPKGKRPPAKSAKTKPKPKSGAGGGPRGKGAIPKNRKKPKSPNPNGNKPK